MEGPLVITTAETGDIAAITQLINNAYRGETASKGWTSEGEYVEGQRITEDGTAELLAREDTGNFKCCQPWGELLGFVSLGQKDQSIYLSLLTVAPHLQDGGIGRQLLAFAETYAHSHSKTAIVITVVNIRHSLIAWYERRGYQITGNTCPFSPEAGRTSKEVHLIEMKKDI